MVKMKLDFYLGRIFPLIAFVVFSMYLYIYLVSEHFASKMIQACGGISSSQQKREVVCKKITSGLDDNGEGVERMADMFEAAVQKA